MDKVRFYRVLDIESPEEFQYYENLASLLEEDEFIEENLIKDLLIAGERGKGHLGFLKFIDSLAEDILAYRKMVAYFGIKFAPVIEIFKAGKGQGPVSELFVCVRQITGFKKSTCFAVRDVGVQGECIGKAVRNRGSDLSNGHSTHDGGSHEV